MTGRGESWVRAAGIAISIRFADAGDVGPFEDIWSGFVTGPVADPSIRARVDAREEAPADGDVAAKDAVVRRSADGTWSVRLAEGRATLAPDGNARIEVGRCSRRRMAWAAHNLLLPILAWELAERARGALVHAAAVVVDDRAFVLAGPEGSGKSTFAAIAAGAGAEVVGQDLTIVVRAPDGRPRLEASPYRTDGATRRGPGSWPLAAILLARHGSPPALAEVRRLSAEARLAANLPYLAAAGCDLDTAAALAASVPVRELTFAPDPSFLDRLRAWRPEAGPRGTTPSQ